MTATKEEKEHTKQLLEAAEQRHQCASEFARLSWALGAWCDNWSGFMEAWLATADQAEVWRPLNAVRRLDRTLQDATAPDMDVLQ